MTAIWLPLTLAAAGLSLSALFSGSETGFYRVSRVRLVLDALGGDRIARGLLWVSNRPGLFVATTLVGTNLANYFASLAIVMGADALTGGRSLAAELAAPILLAPVLFVYGELLPKNLFLRAPNRLLRQGGPLFLLSTALFFPVTMLLVAVNDLLARLIGESPQHVRLTLARRELQRVLEEGHEAGILRPAQRALARGIFAVAKRPVRQCAVPLEGLPRARSDMARDDVLRLARRYRIGAVPVEDAQHPGSLIGYVQVIELELERGEGIGRLHPLMRLPEGQAHLAALIQMQTAKESLALAVDAQGRAVGLLTAARLRGPLLAHRR